MSASYGLLAAALSGCKCGPYPNDAVGFRWEKTAERETTVEMTLTAAGLTGGGSVDFKFSKVGQDGVRCSIPFELQRTVRSEVDWTLTESTESFKHGKTVATYAFTDPPPAQTAGAEGKQPSAAAMAAKPSSGSALKQDASATFEAYPVRASWRLESVSGESVASGESEVGDGSNSAFLNVSLDGKEVQRVVDASPDGARLIVEVGPVDAAVPLASRTLRGTGLLTKADLAKMRVSFVDKPVYRVDRVDASSPQQVASGAVEVVLRCSVSDRGSPVDQVPCRVSWSFGERSGQGFGLSGRIEGSITGGVLQFTIPAEKVDELLRQYPVVSKSDAANRKLELVVKGVVTVGSQSKDFSCAPILRRNLSESKQPTAPTAERGIEPSAEPEPEPGT